MFCPLMFISFNLFHLTRLICSHHVREAKQFQNQNFPDVLHKESLLKWTFKEWHFYLIQSCMSSWMFLQHKKQPTSIPFCGTHLRSMYFLLYFFNLHDGKGYSSTEENVIKEILNRLSAHSWTIMISVWFILLGVWSQNW